MAAKKVKLRLKCTQGSEDGTGRVRFTLLYEGETTKYTKGHGKGSVNFLLDDEDAAGFFEKGEEYEFAITKAKKAEPEVEVEEPPAEQ